MPCSAAVVLFVPTPCEVTTPRECCPRRNNPGLGGESSSNSIEPSFNRPRRGAVRGAHFAFRFHRARFLIAPCAIFATTAALKADNRENFAARDPRLTSHVPCLGMTRDGRWETRAPAPLRHPSPSAFRARVVDVVDIVDVVDRPPSGEAAPFPGLSTESTPDRLDRDGLLPLRATQATEARLGRFCRFGRDVDRPPCGEAAPFPGLRRSDNVDDIDDPSPQGAWDPWKTCARWRSGLSLIFARSGADKRHYVD